ncbi:amidase [Rhizobium binxianense]
MSAAQPLAQIDSNPLWARTITELAGQFGSGEVTPSAVLEAVVQRIDAVNPLVNAFAAIDVDAARKAAAESDARWAARASLSEIDGMIITVKDNILVKDLPCRWGNAVYPNATPEEDEVPIARLRDAGAIILGKTTCSEFSTGRGIVDTRLYGTTRNPWNLEKTTGSSSGGTVAAVASGMGQASIGTDGGGSIRTPASHAGLVGLKPTAGRVARANGLPIILNGREVAAPVARTTDDLAAVFAIIAKSHPMDAQSWGFSDGPAKPALLPQRSQRIRMVTRVGDFPVSPEVIAACTMAAEKLQALGHSVEEGPAPFDIVLQQKGGVIGAAGLAWLLEGQDWKDRIGSYYEKQVETGSKVSGIDYVAANAALRVVQGQIGMFFEDFDLMLSPVTVVPPGPATEQAPAYYNIFTSFVNTAGIPAVSIPSTFSAEGTPIGFQLAGRFGSDWDLLAMARQFERAYPWADRWPSLGAA